ncbi:hypothetical protein fugu_008765 [Takifugu bimaculatus]|uniref:Protein EURL homolog n=1 Tax=Takifugu bimaculatus TaxID=433685 RepID=A0A4Z2AXE0_9TELE|nr:hypothetical protein fugu_008765 [Takifugu bimaculatus]
MILCPCLCVQLGPKRRGAWRYLKPPRSNMEEEEQFENIDLNDDNICSVCKLETETGTLSFCHVCFELNLEGVSAAALLHSRSLRGHRDCFEKCHVIANQKLSCSRGGRSTYQGLKLAVSQRLNQIIQYTQNSVSLGGPSRQAANQHCSSQQGNKLPPQAGSQVPRYTRCWELSNAAAPPAYAGHTGKELGLLPGAPLGGLAQWRSGGGAEAEAVHTRKQGGPPHVAQPQQRRAVCHEPGGGAPGQSPAAAADPEGVRGAD